MKSSNTELISLLKNKNPKGIDLLYEYYGGAVYGIVLRIVKNTVQADKVTQDCFTNIWQTFHLYNVAETGLCMFVLSQARAHANKVKNEDTSKQIFMKRRVYHTSSSWCMSS